MLPEDLAQAETVLKQAIEHRTARSFTVRIRHPKLGIRQIEVGCGVVVDIDHRVERLVGVHLDVTDRQQVTEALRQSNSELARGLSRLARQNRQIKALGWLGEALQNCVVMDEICAPICSFMPVLFDGYSGCIYLRHASGNHLDAVADFGALTGSARVFPPSDCLAIRRGEFHWADARDGLRCRHLPNPERLGITLCVPLIAQGETLGMLFMQPSAADAPAPDPEARQEIERMAAMTADRIGIAIANIQLGIKLKNQSIRDPLTGQFNRRYLEETLEREISRALREQASLAVLMIDVDHFKIFNDTYGHDIGDRVLHLIGVTLAQFCRTGDVVCRFGGEEFVVMMPTTRLAQAAAKAQELCEAVRRIDYKLRIASHPVTISVGVATFPADAPTRDGLLKAADQALYAAKKAGRDRVVCASSVEPW